jgi:hypothetical protein
LRKYYHGTADIQVSVQLVDQAAAFGARLRRNGMSLRQRHSLFTSHLSQHIRVIGDDSVHSDVDHPRNVIWLVDRPHHDLQTEPMGFAAKRSSSFA